MPLRWGPGADQTPVCLFYFYRDVCGLWTNPHPMSVFISSKTHV